MGGCASNNGSMDHPNDIPEQTPAPSINTAAPSSGVDANSSLRSNRRSRSSRFSERESLEEEIRRTVKALRTQVDTERRRADNAERKVREVTGHLKAVNDARLEALRDAGRAKEELRLYKIQLDTAQKEIYRAQDVITTVDRQRLNAEKEAARNRTKARQLSETILIQEAREEAYRLGMKEGLDRGRAIAYAEQPTPTYEDDEGDYDDYLDEESQSEANSFRNQPRPRSVTAPSARSRRSRADSRRNSSPPPIPVAHREVLPVNPPSVRAASVRAAESTRGPSPNPSHARPHSTYAPSAHAPSMRAHSPNPSAQPRSNYAPSTHAPSMRGHSPNPSNAPPQSNYAPSTHAPSMRGRSPNPSNAPPQSNYAPSTHAASIRNHSPNPPSARPPSTYAPSIRDRSPNPSNARAPSTYVPSVRAPSPNPSHAHAPSTRPPSMRAPSPNPSNARPPSNYAPSMRAPSPNPSRPPSMYAPSIPPDNLIPTLDADMRIRLPPPHEFGARTPEPNPSPLPPVRAVSESSQTSQEPLPVPARTGGSSRHRRNSSSGSSALSTLELFSNPYQGGMRTPMSIIEEVNSQASPLHADMRHQRSFSENSAYKGGPQSSYGGDAQSINRPPSRGSYAGSRMTVPPHLQSQQSYTSEEPQISIHPPSVSNKTDSVRGGASQRAVSPSPSHRSGAMPGGHTDYYQSAPSVVPAVTPLRYEPRHPALQSKNRRSRYDDDAVSSVMTADTFTTPAQAYRQEIR